MGSLRDRIQKSKASGGNDDVKVLVALKTSNPDEACRDRFAKLGFNFDRVIANKLIGTIPGDKIHALESDADVLEVERSTTLTQHS